jgi:hypothetical protein
MDRQAQRAAKAQMIAGMQAGQSWYEAAGRLGVDPARKT